MRIILLFISLLSFTFDYSQRIPLSDVELKDNLYTLNGTPYSGNIYRLYKTGQLKYEFEVIDGKKHGTENIYFVDNSFVKEKYTDTLLIQKLDTDLENLNQEISQLQKDRSYEYSQWHNTRYNEIGDKKFNKYEEKYNEGKLKKDKLVLYKKYLVSKNKYDELSVNLKQKRTDKRFVDIDLEYENNKPTYTNKLKASYTYLISSKTVHKEFDKYEKLVLREVLKDGVRNGSYKRYENGKIKEEGTYLNDKKEGLYTVHNNNYRDVTTYSNGLKNGLYKKYKGDVVTISGTYSDDLIEGEWKEFDYNGNITLESAYLNDTLNGVYKKYNGEVVMKEGQYTNGLMNGEWIFRHNNGNIKGEGKYVDGDGGNVGSTGMPINGREGEWVFYHENGNKNQESNYLNDKLHGESKTYHENGNIRTYGKYLNGLTDGKYTWYFENGSKESVRTYVNGLAEGKYISYHENGQISQQSTKVNGEYDGESKTYHKNGKIRTSGTYINGKIDGLYFWYREDGTIEHKFKVSYGTQISQIDYDENGNEIKENNSYSNNYTKKRCGGRIEKRWEEYSNYTQKITLTVVIECPYCSDTERKRIAFRDRNSDCDETEHECSTFSGCGKKSILKPCLIKHLDKGDRF